MSCSLAFNGNSVFCFRAYSPYNKSTPASARSRNSLESKSHRCHQANKKDPSDDESFLLAGDEARLGFAPRSNSLVYEPTVLTNSIFSLSGLAISLRRPSANPPNPLKLIQLLTHTKPIKKPAFKAGFFIGGDGGSRTHVHCG